MNLTGPGGASTGSATYAAYGEGLATTGESIPAMRFTGEQQGATTGFYYLRARYYDPAIGRFITKDPYPGSLGVPGSLNPYAYVLDSPANFVDPSGRCFFGKPCTDVNPIPGLMHAGDEAIRAGGDLFEALAERQGRQIIAETDATLALAERFMTASCASFAVNGASFAAQFLGPLAGIPANALAFGITAYIDAKEGDMANLSLDSMFKFLGTFEFAHSSSSVHKFGKQTAYFGLGTSLANCALSAARG